MFPTTIRTPPVLEDLIPLAEYQAQTPASFDGKPVLHYHVTSAKVWVPLDQRQVLPLFPADAPTEPESAPIESEGRELLEQKIDIYVTSENLTLFNPIAQVGVSIPYPIIAIHAIKPIQPGSQTQSVWTLIEFGEASGPDDEDPDTVELTFIPPPQPPSAPDAEEIPKLDAEALYKAIATCSDLHPNPSFDEDDDEDDRIIWEGDVHAPLDGFTGVLRGATDGGMPPPMPGSSGWITAENVHEYFDEEGNWLGDGDENEGGSLGEGAGRVRGRDEVEEEQVNGHNDEDAENKRPRVD